MARLSIPVLEIIERAWRDAPPGRKATAVNELLRSLRELMIPQLAFAALAASCGPSFRDPPPFFFLKGGAAFRPPQARTTEFVQGMILPSGVRSYASADLPSGDAAHSLSSCTVRGGRPCAPSNARYRDLIVTLASRHKLPAVYYERFFVTGGGLTSYGTDFIDHYRRAAGTATLH